MCFCCNSNHQLYKIHQTIILLFLFLCIKKVLNLEITSDNGININRSINLLNYLTNSPLENGQQFQLAEAQLVKIKRFHQTDSKLKNNSFRINRNTIIRTQDSRANGAKYLNETEKPTNEDCLKWCLQTKQCNLAVYEEKNQGSCYLFDCGVELDFKCKFTKHNFYTSSVLEIKREENNSAFQQQRVHENDLINLRKKVPINTTYLSGNKSPNNSTTKQTLLNVESQEKKCQKYQFSCKNGKECIAIYNICDNIKQCTDGSDEAEELHCSDSFNQINQLLSISSSKVTEASAKTLKDKKQNTNQFRGNITPDFNYKKLPEIVKLAKAQNSIALNNIKNSLNNNMVKPWPSILSFDSNRFPIANWIDYYANYINTLNNPNTLSPTNQNSQLNLNRQDNPVDSKNINSLIWQMMDSNQQQQIFNVLAKNIQEQKLLQTLLNKQQLNNLSDNSNKNSETISNSNHLNLNKNKPLTNHQITQDSRIEYKIKPKIESVESKDYRPINLLDKSTTKNSNKTSDLRMRATLIENLNPKGSNWNKDHYVSYDFKQPFIQFSGKEDYYLDENEQDTNSAVIALVLGLFITIMLIAIVGFRMRSIKKRIQRRGGRTALTHDTDYLINGMYL